MDDKSRKDFGERAKKNREGLGEGQENKLGWSARTVSGARLKGKPMDATEGTDASTK